MAKKIEFASLPRFWSRGGCLSTALLEGSKMSALGRVRPPASPTLADRRRIQKERGGWPSCPPPAITWRINICGDHLHGHVSRLGLGVGCLDAGTCGTRCWPLPFCLRFTPAVPRLGPSKLIVARGKSAEGCSSIFGQARPWRSRRPGSK